MGTEKKSNGFFRYSFCKLNSRKLAVSSVNVVIVRVTLLLWQPRTYHACNSVNENVVHFINEVQTRLLLAEKEGFEPSLR